MAKLTLTQQARDIEREKAKQEAIQKKMEIQQNKELYGENWREVLQQKMQHEIEVEVGSDKLPKIYDSKDLYDYFDPVLLYRDEEYKPLNMDFKKFSESEVQYKKAIEDLDRELAELNKKENLNKENLNIEEKENKEKETETDNKEVDNKEENIKVENTKIKNEEILKKDGVIQEDKDLPISAERTDKTDEAREYARAINEKPAAVMKGKLNQIISTYFNRFTPLYNKHVCTCCGTPLSLDNYYVVYNLTCSNRVDENGSYHMWICKSCVQKLFAYCYAVLSNKNVELAMQYTCTYLNLYWDVDLFYQAKQNFFDSDRKGTLIGAYIGLLNLSTPGFTFLNSPFLSDEQYNSETRMVVSNKDEAPFDWSAEDAHNKKEIIRIVGYDPFAYEDDEDEKKILYADLVSVIDEDVQQDYVKMQSAITIVKSFNKVRKLDEKAHKLEQEDAPLNDQKSLADLKAKELKAISDFSRDSGFSERFKTRQSQGQTSFTGIVKMMNEKKYENELINKYDVETSSTIQAAADASFKAIFNQLNLSEAEAYKLAAEQLEELRKIKKENAKLTEELRQAKYQISELNLKEKNRKAEEELDD